jgi:hypothetical protein
VSNLIPQHDMNASATNVFGVPVECKCPFDVQLQGNNVFLMPNYNEPTAGQTGTISVAKTNVNTARFGELWRAYWNVMVDQSTTMTSGSPSGTPFAATAEAPEVLLYKGNHFDASRQPNFGAGEEHPQQMFRSSLRDPRGGGSGVVYFTPDQQLLLRAALAAVNTEDLRDADNVPTRRDIRLSVSNSGGSPISAIVSVYGVEAQPYITEVYVNTETRDDPIASTLPNPKGYIAIELYNPYPFDIDISGWGLAVLDRRGAGDPPTGNYANTFGTQFTSGLPGQRGLSYFYIHNGTPTPVGLALTPPTPIPPGTVVPANGYLVLDNYNPNPVAGEEAAQTLPVSIAGTRVYIQNLHWVIHDEEMGSAENGGFGAANHIERRGGELVILRPLGSAPPLLSDANTVPIDSFDFTGLYSAAKYGSLGTRSYRAWHYIRSNSTGTAPNWKFVYPGRYQGDSTTNRSQGIVEREWPDGTVVVGDPDPSAVKLGAADMDAAATYVTRHTIQLNAAGFPGPHPIATAGTAPNVHPYGAFARNADILQVTFIGSYRVGFADPVDLNMSVLEVNPVTMDSCFGNDSDPQNDDQASDTIVQSREQVGRFAPIRDRTATSLYDDLNPDGDFNRDSTNGGNKWRYRWAIDLFDYLTVNSPGNDYLPDVPTNQQTPYTPQREPVDNDGDVTVGDIDTTTPTTTQGPGVEDAVPVQGLINVNTAPWRVIGALPFLPAGDTYGFAPGATPGSGTWTPSSPDGEEDNITLAKQIVAWRDGRPGPGGWPAQGPFRSAFDFYRVPAFVDLQEKLVTATAGTGGPDDADGDFTPYNAGSAAVDPVRYDFEEQFLLLNRVSNLVTTRSDSFTVYILVQGWRNVGTPTPEVVAQRRVAFIQDRTTVRPESPALPPPVNVPNE